MSICKYIFRSTIFTLEINRWAQRKRQAGDRERVCERVRKDQSLLIVFYIFFILLCWRLFAVEINCFLWITSLWRQSQKKRSILICLLWTLNVHFSVEMEWVLFWCATAWLFVCCCHLYNCWNWRSIQFQFISRLSYSACKISVRQKGE